MADLVLGHVQGLEVLERQNGLRAPWKPLHWQLGIINKELSNICLRVYLKNVRLQLLKDICGPYNRVLGTKSYCLNFTRELPDIMYAIFWPTLPLSTFGSDLYYKIHGTTLTTSTFPCPSPPDADIISGSSRSSIRCNSCASFVPRAVSSPACYCPSSGEAGPWKEEKDKMADAASLRNSLEIEAKYSRENLSPCERWTLFPSSSPVIVKFAP